MCEGLGLEAGVSKKFSEAPEFYWLYTAIIVLGAAAILMPGVPLLPIILVSQILNGILLPVVLYFMISLVNREEIMGRFRNGALHNVVTWVTIIALGLLSAVLVVTSVLAPS